MFPCCDIAELYPCFHPSPISHRRSITSCSQPLGKNDYLLHTRRAEAMKKRFRIVYSCSIMLLIVTGGELQVAAFQAGPLKVGGAVRANYVLGDYVTDGSDGPQRGGNGGDFELDTFRVNLDYAQNNFLGKVEYRFYNGYNFLHTGWIGYNFSNGSQVQIGVNRVPFGIGDYGAENSWFFDQHFYVGLCDDMDLGAKYSLPLGNLVVDAAYYAGAEFEGLGDSTGSARYSYDIVDDASYIGKFPHGRAYASYIERNQLNLRGTYTIDTGSLSAQIGISLQWGQLEAQTDLAEDSDAFAFAVHANSNLGPWAIKMQLSHYKYQADYTNGANNDLIAMGAYDFAWPVASEGTIPSIALSYTWSPKGIDWIDSITFYNDYSVIIKKGDTLDGTPFNDSALNVTGMSIASGGWYIYVDYAISNGNYFVGNEEDTYATFSDVSDFGINGPNDWDRRFNINFGYYF